MAGLSPQVVGEYLLAFFGNVATTPGIMDRRSNTPAGVHHETGLPMSANDLAPTHRAVSGRRLAMEHQVLPRAFAAGLLRRVQTGPEGEEILALAGVPESGWTDSERGMVEDVTRMVKVAAHRLTEVGGYFILRPPGGDDQPLALDEEGLTLGIKITGRGLDAAIQLVRQRPDLRWKSISPEGDLGKEVWRTAPQWAQKKYAEGDQLPITV